MTLDDRARDLWDLAWGERVEWTYDDIPTQWLWRWRARRAAR